MRFSTSTAALVVASAATVAWGQTTLFTTENYLEDKALWTDPAYFRYNTARELTDMVELDRYGERGSGSDLFTLTSPYPFKTSEEHYEAWLAAADGGTQHTVATLPNWDGIWSSSKSWLDSDDVQASTIVSALTPQYRDYYVQQVKAEAEGRHWWAGSFCLPNGYIRSLWRSPREFVLRPGRAWIISNALTEVQVRWIATDGSGHSPSDYWYPKWQGESVGFWDGNALVLHTNQIKGWNTTHSMIEWSDSLTAVERYERVGDVIVGEVTLYDPNAFVEPLYSKFEFRQLEGLEYAMTYDTCTDTNGPSSNVFINAKGLVDERAQGDPLYWDPSDPRPWARQYAIGETPGAMQR